MKHTGYLVTRRSFLRHAVAGAAAYPLLPGIADSKEQAPITKVHVIFKTHLDIGFTDLAENVVATYINEFIPVAIRLARETREQQGDKCFKWTTGSWLIHTFLERADSQNRTRMEQAIEAGDICWHAMPFTTHSEVLDPSIYEAGLQLSQKLDERYGKTTISAKMTDVPGHTRSIVPLLQRNGVSLLHIGVNPASMPPDVPPVFIWKAPDDSQIAVMYQKDYGGIMQIPHTSEAVALMFTGDNHGPQTVGQVMEAYKNMQIQFPDAAIVASDLNEVGKTLSRVQDKLPVIISELGDSWIHGIGSDPLKIAQLRALSRERNTWIRDSALEKHRDTDLAFCLPLCMVGEHTWGLDVKTHLQAWDIYIPNALAEARKTEPFQRIEASWQEKREYIQNAVGLLPEPLKSQAKATLEELKPVLPDLALFERLPNPGITAETTSLSFALDASGALAHLQNKATGREWASPRNPMALFSYQTFSKEDYDRFMDHYLTGRPDWALKDFGKPGMEAFGPRSCTYFPRLKAAWQREEETQHILLAEMEVVTDDGLPVPGCPSQIITEYCIHKEEPVIDITLKWFGKKANRLPEALWFSFIPITSKGGAWVLDKMGQDVDPADVVNNGGHKLHAVAEGVRYAEKQGIIRVDTLDAPLVAPGDGCC